LAHCYKNRPNYSDYLPNKTTPILKIEQFIEHTLVQHIIDLATSIKRNGSLVSAQIDLTTQQWMILLLLAGDPNHPYMMKDENKKLMASDIADALGVSRPNITNLINSLVEKGLVVQVDDVLDRRKKQLDLTPAAFGIIGAIEPLRIDANRRLLGDFTEEEKKLFLSFLQRCSNYLNRNK
jgi:DNA-binding MarR family transcriptional regulator